MSSLRPSKPTIRLEIKKQESESHCGPAVLQALLAFLKTKVSQTRIVEAARVKNRIIGRGMRPQQMAEAVAKVSSEYKFWFKQHATVDDLDLIINKYEWPVAVNWQGLFYDHPDDEEMGADYDPGHYSIVIGLNRAKDEIIIADPYREYSKKPRHFSLAWFEKRWWDTARDKNPKTKQIETIMTHHFLFVITDKKQSFPKELDMLPPNQLSILKQQPLLSRIWSSLSSVMKNK